MSIYAQEFNFGAGTLWGTRTDVPGATPRQFGTLQDCQIAISGDIKPLYGSKSYAIALAVGKRKIELMPKFAAIQSGVFFDLYFGVTPSVGQALIVNNGAETDVVPVGGTVTVAQGTAWLADLGVYYALTGLPLKATLSATPASVGTYYVAGAGRYVFNTGDVSASISPGYSYNSPTTGQSATISNPVMGFCPTFQATFTGTFDGRQANFTFVNCVSGKLTMPTKQDDWEIYDMSIEASANAAGNVAVINIGGA